MLVNTNEPFELKDVIRDFKKDIVSNTKRT